MGSVVDVSGEGLDKMSRNKRKRIKKRKRESIGYDAEAPEMCLNCKHFNNHFTRKPTGEYFPPRCELHKMEVNRYAVCNTYSDNHKPTN